MADVATPDTTAPVNGDAGAGTGAPSGTDSNVNTEVTASWLDTMPDELKTNEALKAYKEPAELAKAHLDLVNGKTAWESEKAEILKAKEELEAKYKAPETAEEYVFDVPEDLPKDDNFIKWFKDTAHALKLPADTAKGLADAYMGLYKAQIAEVQKQEQAQKDAEAAETEKLRQEWGPAKYDAEKKLAQQAMKNPDLVTEAEYKFYKNAGFLDDPMFLRLFNRISKVISEDALIDGKRGGTPQIERSISGTPMLDYNNSPSMPKKGKAA